MYGRTTGRRARSSSTRPLWTTRSPGRCWFIECRQAFASTSSTAPTCSFHTAAARGRADLPPAPSTLTPSASASPRVGDPSTRGRRSPPAHAGLRCTWRHAGDRPRCDRPQGYRVSSSRASFPSFSSPSSSSSSSSPSPSPSSSSSSSSLSSSSWSFLGRT